MPSQETWERFSEEVNVKVNGVRMAIDEVKNDNSALLIEITRLGERLGGKMDAVHKRMDGFEKEIINLNHTVNGNTVPGIKTRLAVTESRQRLIGGILGVIGVAIILTYLELK